MMDEADTRKALARDIASLDTAHQRTYEVRTYGCQMNVHDSERMSGALEAAGYSPADPDDIADAKHQNAQHDENRQNDQQKEGIGCHCYVPFVSQC